MQTVVAPDGTSLAVFVSGSGPPLVLVHGTSADHARWAPVLPSLQRRFTVYAMDRRGRGGSGDRTPYEIQREFDDVAAVVDAIGGPVILLGHSYGAVCALEASTRTTSVDRLILYEPPIPTGIAMYPPELVDELERLLAEGRGEDVLVSFFRQVVRMPPEELEMLRGLPNWPARVAAARTIPREMRLDETYAFDPARFRDMRAPTLLLLGGDSPPLFQRAIATVHAALPASRIEVLPGQQHTAINTAPELFVDAVVSFLTDA